MFSCRKFVRQQLNQPAVTMTMKKTTLLLICAFTFLLACNNDSNEIPDTSKIDVDLTVQRFDRDFLAIDTANVIASLNQLNSKYPTLTPIFLQNILGLDSAVTAVGVKRFIQLSEPINKQVATVFNNTDAVEKDFEKAFRFVKYYFPQYQVPKLVTIVGPIDALAQTASGFTPDFLGPDFLGISLQFYLGRDFEAYNSSYFLENVAPGYRSRRFSKEYIIADGMQLVVDDLFPDRSNSRPLLEQMVEKGKQWWLLDKFLPQTPDSIKTGYTAAQLEWCETNEGLIWSYITKNERLDAIDMPTIQTYIGEGPFTQGFSQELSPGNLGQWIGWRIVDKYAKKNPGMKPDQVMQTAARTIIDEAKYKPK
ncbi:MAG TPA: hypothetical protein VFZ42_00295 [Chitinophagaceae bacterium]